METAELKTLSMREYLDLKAVGSSTLHTLMSESPLHAWMGSPWNPNRERNDSETADIGTLAHACLLEGGTDNCEVIDPRDYLNADGKTIPTGWTNKAIKAARDLARSRGEIPILKADFDSVQKMVRIAQDFMATSELRDVFDGGYAEETLLFDMNGVHCKARPDLMSKDRAICLSYKTTKASAHPDKWIRTQLPQYDAATVFYERAVSTVFNVDCLCVHLCQEQQEPYSCSLIALSPAFREVASVKLDHGLQIWKRCEESGKWPAYTSRICYAEPRPWQMAEAEEREIETAFTDDELAGGLPL